MEITTEQNEVLQRLARIATVHDVMNREVPNQKPATIVATTLAANAALVQSWLNAKDPTVYREELDGVTRQIGSCFLLLIHLCGSLGLDALTVIDEEFATQLKNLDIQKAAMKAMQEEVTRRQRENGVQVAR